MVSGLLLICISCVRQSEEPVSQELKLWYKQPAERWLDALPLGNGRLGVMVHGGVEKEHLGMNISTLWSGAPDNEIDNPEAAEHLDEIRQLLFNGDYSGAQGLCTDYLLGNKNAYGTHLPMAELYINFKHKASGTGGYFRQLDLETAISRVEYNAGDVLFTRECFVSNPDQLIVLHLKADKKGELEFSIALDGGNLPHEISIMDPHTLIIAGRATENKHSNGRSGVNFQGWIRIHDTNGRVDSDDGLIRVSDADHATLLIAANTSYHDRDPAANCRQQLEKLSGVSYRDIRKRHISDYRELFHRVSLDLGKQTQDDLPTDQRLAELEGNPDDPQLYALFYQYGRYLLIASSRENSPLPANLQGIWNDHLASEMQWTCDFHLDINTQQNYWPAEPGNLSECHEPLFRLIEGMVEPGRETARRLYASDGWVAHVFTNAWGYTSPGWGLGWGLHVTGGIWIASHLWHHYEYTGDLVFLRECAYPVLKEAAEFFLDYMVVHPKYGWLVTGPSLSPENRFIAHDGKAYAETMAPTVDIVLIHELFTTVMEASVILDVDQELRESLQAARDKLPQLQIGKYNQLQEWLEDYEEAVPNHRHISHLVALYPGSLITPEDTPGLAAAARVTIERRTGQHNWEDVEWSVGNLINFYARLGDAEMAYQNLHTLLTDHTDHNMLTFSRSGIAGAAHNIFVLDGNTSGANGISEMLVQSYKGKIYLLPALPSEWAEGSIKGVCTRGGFEVDMVWWNGILSKVKILSKLGNPLKLVYGELELSLETRAGASYEFDGDLSLKNK